MIFPGGDSGEKPRDESGPGPSEGTHEAPPIEQMPQPAYDAPQGYPPPTYAPPYSPPTYQPPGYPPHYGAPPPGYVQPDGRPYGAYPPPAGTNALAIASLVSSVLGVLCGFGGLIGIVLGWLAIRQIRRTHQEGFGLAVAGIVIGVASVIIVMIWMIYAVR